MKKNIKKNGINKKECKIFLINVNNQIIYRKKIY